MNSTYIKSCFLRRLETMDFNNEGLRGRWKRLIERFDFTGVKYLNCHASTFASMVIGEFGEKPSIESLKCLFGVISVNPSIVSDRGKLSRFLRAVSKGQIYLATDNNGKAIRTPSQYGSFKDPNTPYKEWVGINELMDIESYCIWTKYGVIQFHGSAAKRLYDSGFKC